MRRRSSTFDISVDPLTDIVANTVGIILFVLIFGVLTARGTSVASKHLPHLVAAKTENRVEFIAAGNELRPFTGVDLINQLSDEFKNKIQAATYDNISAVALEMRHQEASDAFYKVEIETDISVSESQEGNYLVRRPEILSRLATITPAGEGGDKPSILASSASGYKQKLSSLDKNGNWVYFYVDADSVEVFQKAQKLARDQGFGVGWRPERFEWPLRYNLWSDETDDGVTIDDVLGQKNE